MNKYPIPVFSRLKNLPKPAKPKRNPKPKQTEKKADGRVKFSDHDILTARFMYREGYTCKQISFAIPGMTERYALLVVRGKTRKNVK